MNYKIEIEGFEGKNIEVQPAGFFSGYKLYLNREPAQKGPKRGQMVLHKNDGTALIATWKPQVLGLDVPQLLVDGKTITIVDPLTWYEYLWNGLPIFLVFQGGAIGAMVGMVGFSINTKIFRSSRSLFSKYALTAAVSVGTFILYFILAMLILALIQ